ncbi:hypothetical protein ANO11243_010630 [Dothideomycetidae sp. 11243]|nr:hypothetical protein ANO11243_010630 [fungal sp. No.11243]
MPDATESHDQNIPDSASSPAINGNPIQSETATTTEQVPVKDEIIEQNGHAQDEEPLKSREDSEGFRSAKKRKFDELNERPRSTSRAASPPWKAFAADGPTQFTENGKRRSGRVNYIPLELQPPSNKRTTRAAHESSITHKAQQHTPIRQAGLRSNGPKPEGKLASPAKWSATKVQNSSSKLYKQEQSGDSPKHHDELPMAPVTPSTPVSVPVKRRPGRPRRDERPPVVQPVKTPPEARRSKRASMGDSKDAQRPLLASPKLRLKLSRGPMYPRHPDFIPKVPKFPTLIEALEFYDQKERETGPDGRNEESSLDMREPSTKPILSPDEIAELEAKARLRILEAARPEGPLSQERNSLFFPDEQTQPLRQFSQNDHLWAHGAYFRVLMRRERTKHIELAKKTAYACLAKWKERQPQTDEERAKEQNEWFRLIYKQTVKDVQRKWELVTAEIERRRLARWIEEQELTRDRKMQRLLEDTTKMLDRRRVGFEDSEFSGTEDNDRGQDDFEGSHDGDGMSNSGSDDSGLDKDDDDDNMSSSESDTEAEDGLDADENLSPEALRAKYANIPALELDPDDDGVDEDADAMDVDTQDDVVDDGPEQTEVEDMSHVVLEEVDEALMDDDDDESTDMSDDMGSSDEDDSASDDEVSDEEQDEDDSMGLMGFLGGQERKLMQELPAEDQVEPSERELVGDNEAERATVEESDPTQLGVSDVPSLQPATSVEEDHSSQPTPMDSSVAAPTEVDSTTTLDPDEIARIMPTAEETQTARRITTKVPTLLRGTLREYQHFGLDWLAKLYANQTNGILADEMGLGKTIQTIALLAHLAEEHEVWGPHLIVVPTSVILNWEMEFKKFLPGFKVLSYYGTQEERQQKRKGWSNPDNYNVVITSYQLILKDLSSIRVPEWHYMILDEAHNIKNFQSQRYQAMIRLKTHARLLLTGTPLQNSIQELWSLLTFLTAGQDGQGMGDLDEFTQWFKRPVDEIFVDGKNKLGVEAQEIVNKLHHSLRPYILRRMKAQVEKQLPGKYEHTIFCRLSKRQRQLYDAFLSRTDVKEKLSSGNPISVSQALMALRKVCNHPDLFEERPIVTSFTIRKPYSKMPRSVVADYEIKDLLIRRDLLQKETMDAEFDNLILRNFDLRRRERLAKHHARRGKQLSAGKYLQRWLDHMTSQRPPVKSLSGSSLTEVFASMQYDAITERLQRLQSYIDVTEKRANFEPILGADLVARCTVLTTDRLPMLKQPRISSGDDTALIFDDMHNLGDIVQSTARRGDGLIPTVSRFGFVTPNATSQDLVKWSTTAKVRTEVQRLGQSGAPDPFHEARVRLSIAFPDKRLLQYDCGKLQRLAVLLRELNDRGSRALIFTQMTSVLDILERFLNIHGYKYMRLDGSTRIEQRQDMMERFNRDERIDVFILSSRSGGVGMNLTGADSVIFYDLDWNPQMDKQCQDRAHRIGQTRDVHIYKMVSEHTIEVNILKKSNQKRMLDEVVIQEGEFTTDFFNRVEETTAAEDDSYEAHDAAGAAVDRVLGLDRRAGPLGNDADVGKTLAAAEESIDVEAAKAQLKEAYLDEADFDFDNNNKKTPRASGAATPVVATAADTPAGESADDAEDVVPHVDEYMLRFVQRALDMVAFVPPVDRTKKGRLDKNGRDRGHRSKKM